MFSRADARPKCNSSARTLKARRSRNSMGMVLTHEDTGGAARVLTAEAGAAAIQPPYFLKRNYVPGKMQWTVDST
jgi:hypothetical protein